MRRPRGTAVIAEIRAACCLQLAGIPEGDQMRHAIMLLSVAAAGCPAASADNPGPKRDIDPKADELLHKMSASLAAAQAFQFEAGHTLEVVTKAGEKLQFVAQSRVSVQRPNKLRSDRTGAFADAALYYDGKSITIFGKRIKMYASTPAPGTLDGAIDFAREKLDLDAPGADLLYADAYAGLMQDVTSGQYIGNEPIGDRMCHHLAYRERGTDWQIWIEDSPQALPCRYVITSNDVAGVPEFTVSLTSWNLAPKLTPAEFVFTPPSDATKIEFLGVKESTTQGRNP